MKTTSKFIALAALGMSVSACSLIKRTAYNQQVAESYTIQAPMIADMEVDLSKKIQSTYHQTKGNEALAKSGVLYVAMEDHGCDVIVQPYFELSIGKKAIDATVNGYCGKYTNIRKPNLEDVTLMQELNEAMPMFEPAVRTVEKRKVLIRK